MASETTQSWGRRGKRTSVIALGLVAALAGVAVAYFVAETTVPDNLAKGGTLSVNTDLPMNFTGGTATDCATPTGTGTTGTSCDTLYPLTTTTKPSSGAASDSFTVTNNNAVKVAYTLYATCTFCVQNPGSPEDQQFQNLYIDIRKPAGPSSPTDALNPPATPVYSGKLADLNADNIKTLDTVNPGADQVYDVTIWLHDDGTAQPQNVLNNWEFVVDAKTTGS
jgi:hypothetical protein